MNDDSADPQQPEAPVQLTEQQLRARRARSIAIALALGAFVVLVFVVTLVRLGARVATPPI
ncbi:MAG: CoxF protein [Hyphomicrobiales bacterium]|nr:CoxF protein [Hyphomicrobiales bacterium]